ncbi:ABC transporter permease [Candidatus Dojkabacteria bacterium]|nr:ABC transporter permease [Candidatus Dojkabacteria bacterium]
MERTSNDKDLLIELVRTNFKLKYNDSLLGFFWAILKPFLIFGMLYIVFSNVSRGQDQKSFQIYLLIGIIIYNYFNESIVMGMNSLLEKAHIILKVNFNRTIAVYSNQVLAGINLIINLLILALFLLFNDVYLELDLIAYFAFVLLTLTILTLGISFFTSVIFIRFRDLLHITEIGLQLLFYASAIFFPISLVPERISIFFVQEIPAREIFELNPLYILIQAARNTFINGQISYLYEVLLIFIISLLFVLIGRAFFKSRVKKVAEFF